MHGKAVIAMLLAAALSGCVSLYSREREWKLPPGLGPKAVHARMDAGLFTWGATIAVDDEEVLAGRSWFWSDTLDMKGSYAALPLAAQCDRSEKTCALTIAGFPLPKVHFRKQRKDRDRTPEEPAGS